MPDQGHHQGLIFQWLAREGRTLKLIVGVTATLLTLTGLSLLFQVSYPAARRHPLAAQRAVLLDGSTPESRSILDQVRDQDFLLVPPANDAQVPLAAKPPVFEPSFKDYELQPKDIIESRVNASTALPRVFLPERPLLPPVAQPPVATARPVAPPQALKAVIVEGLAKRKVARAAPLDGTRFAEIAGTQYRIAVAANGSIKLVMPMTDPGSQSDLYSDICSVLNGLRFEPNAGTGVEWGTVALKWQPEKP